MHRILILCLTCLLLIAAPIASFAQPDYIRSERLGIAHVSSVDVPRSEERYARALELGAGWNRWPLYWDRVEARSGRFDWSAYDALVEEDLSYGLQLNVILLGIPAHRRAGESIENLNEPVFADGTNTPSSEKPINPDHYWARFVAEAVQRYMPNGRLAEENGWDDDEGVRVWEIWNEPDYEFFWSAGVVDYARLMQVAYLVIKAYDPDATVMVGGLLYPTQDNWLARMLAIYERDPAAEDNNWYMDAVAVHNYGDAWRTGWLTLVARQTLLEYGFTRPIWVTETGVPIWDDYPGPLWTAEDPEARRLLATAEQQAAFMIQSAAYAWAEGAQVVIYHQLYDDCGNQPPGTDFAPTAADNPICHPGEICAGDVFGIYRNPESAICFSQHPQPDSPRPVADAYRLLAEVMGTLPFSRRGFIDDARDDGVIQISFTRPEADERVVFIWNTLEEAVDYEMPALGDGGALYTLEGEAEIAPTAGSYSLRLPPAQMARQRFAEPRIPVDIGGMPLILVERVTDEIALGQLLFQTGEAATAPLVTPTPTSAVTLAEGDINALLAESPNGVVFVALQAARLRNLPTTEGSQVVATLSPNTGVGVIGRLEDGSWLQVGYEGQEVWVASFLGEVFGDLANVPIVIPDAAGQ
jgi:hypothetical protein